MSEQYGFYYDAERCVQCHTCELACKSTNNTEPGIRWRRLIESWEGSYPDVKRIFFSLACMHCEKPACAEACPTGAISKRAEDGIVVVDSEKCNGCRDCFEACPYGVPQFGQDGIMQKCDYCLGAGRTPACVESCPADAIFAGTLDELAKMAKEKKKEAAGKMNGATGPALIIAGKSIFR